MLSQVGDQRSLNNFLKLTKMEELFFNLYRKYEGKKDEIYDGSFNNNVDDKMRTVLTYKDRDYMVVLSGHVLEDKVSEVINLVHKINVIKHYNPRDFKEIVKRHKR